MDFQLSEEQKMLKKMVRDFAEKEVYPRTAPLAEGEPLPKVHGGYGYSKEYGLERIFRDAWGWGVAGGTIQMQKITIASELLGRRFKQRN